MLLLPSRTLCRWLSTVMAACCLFLNLALPSQHTDCLHPHDAARLAQADNRIADSAVRATRQMRRVQQDAPTRLQRVDRCLACEWQAGSVSPALSTFGFRCVTADIALRIPSRLARALPTPAPDAASRAPPVA